MQRGSGAPRRLLVVVTGASRGFGAAVTEQAESVLGHLLVEASRRRDPSIQQQDLATPDQGHVLLLARSLPSTSTRVECPGPGGAPAWTLHKHRRPMDLTSPSPADLDAAYRDVCARAGLPEAEAGEEQVLYGWDAIYLIHNAGTLGPLVQVAGGLAERVSCLPDFLALNVSSPILLTTDLVRRWTMAGSRARLFVVNISSLAAIQPFEGWALYCTAKAARDMFFRVLATEQQDHPAVTVLNYAPGPLATDMQRQIREEMPPGKVHDTFIRMHQQGQLVPCAASAAVLWGLVLGKELAGTSLVPMSTSPDVLLLPPTWTSGDHLDYYDWAPPAPSASFGKAS